MAGEIKVVYVEPKREARIITMTDKYEEYRRAVCGDIEYAYFFEDVAIVCNGEGKIRHMPLNRSIERNGKIVDILAGPFIVVSRKDGEQLSDKQLQKYYDIFRDPEIFQMINIDGEMKCVSKKTPNKRRFKIYQLPFDDDKKFRNFDSLKRKYGEAYTISEKDYENVYKGDLLESEDLEDIYYRFNLNHPLDYHYPSLSVSDVVVVTEASGENIAYYVDSIGFKKIEKFCEKEPE